MIGPLRRWRVMGAPERRPSYDVVIIGGGVHGLAIAYELAKRGVRDVAVLERSYIGAGGSGRNTAIIRSNYRTPEGVTFYDESVSIYERLSVELGFNVLFSQHGHLTLAHTELGDRRAARPGRGRTSSRASIRSSSIATRSPRSRRRSTCPTGRATRSTPRSTTRRAASSVTTPSCGATRDGHRTWAWTSTRAST